jgi:heme/copper-type cytochrome/quinol oxidase subunit 2
MKESTKKSLGIASLAVFIIGFLLFLTAVHTTGESIERLNLIVLWSTILIVGIFLGVIGLVALFVLYFPDLRKNIHHKTS